MALENKLGLTSSADLAREEERISKKKAVWLFESGTLDKLPVGTFASLKAIHKALFEDIYDFAGELRAVNLAKGNFRFALLITDKGLLNSVVRAFDGENINWYFEPKYWPYILVIMHVWKVIGYSMVVYLASITGIDSTLYEAASLDGASKWQQAWYVTIPSLKPIIIMMFIMAVGHIFSSDFGLFYQVPMDSGPLYDVTNTIDTYVYRGLIRQNNVGMSSAAGFYQSIIGFVLVLLANYAVRRISKENALF